VSEPNTPEHPHARAGWALQLFWRVVGNAIVYTSLFVIIVNQFAFPGIFDGVIWFTVVLMIVARRVDITRGQGTTAGDPATLVHWRDYAVTLVWLTAIVSTLAHLIER
jgi:uncharacterized membrane protein YecN with MAPEG domain